jgi:hypothetical protein
VAALHHSYFAAYLCESAWEESAALTGTYYNHIILCGLWHPISSFTCTYIITASHLQEALRFIVSRNEATGRDRIIASSHFFVSAVRILWCRFRSKEHQRAAMQQSTDVTDVKNALKNQS